MGNFFKSLFSSSKAATPEEEKSKNDQKNFDILKYDGVRAQKIGQVAYAIKCFTEALKLQEDFETMTYLVAAYTTANKAEEALEVLNRMVELEPDHINTLLTRVNVLFMLDKDADVIVDCRHILELEETNHLAWFLMGKAKRTTSDPLGAIADLTKAIALKEDFTDAYLMRARILLSMQQATEALPDVEKAMQEGWSTASDEIRAQGFGAGMGLPNMKKYTDNMQIDTVLGVGTTISLRVDLH